MALEFSTMTAAGRFGDECELPILDLRPLMPDEVLRNIPRFLGRWEDGQSMRIMLDDNWDITTSSDDCDPSIASRQTLECKVLIPDQKLVSVGFPELPYRDTLKRFCSPRGITSFPTFFNRDGSFNTANPLSGVFLRFLLAELRGPFMKHLRETAWSGNPETRHQFQGILPQLDDGPLSAGDGCDLYQAVDLDWDVLTGNTGTDTVPSADMTVDNVIIKGVNFPGLTGLNLVEFMVLWFERLLEHDLAAWANEDMEWELWVGTGQTTCIANLAACMQPCDGCVNPMSDPEIRERAAEFRKTRMIWLYPYDNISITIRTSPQLHGRMVLVPKTIGGRPMVAWVFRDQQEEMDILSGELPWYGSQVGLPDANELYPPDPVIDSSEFERRAFSLHLQRNGNCIQAWINTEAAIVVAGLPFWLLIDGVDCAGLVPPVTHETMSRAVTVCATVGGETDQLDLTVAALEADGTVTAGDTYVVYFDDGYTALIGTVVSYNTGTDVLRVSFAADLDCDTGGGPVSVVKLADNTP